MPEYADCLAGLVETLRLEKPHLLGHSYGGALALEVYRRHPTLPATLILAGGSRNRQARYRPTKSLGDCYSRNGQPI